MYKEELSVARAMIKHGGSFIRHIGKALIVADCDNSQKIKETWADEYAKYLKFADKTH